MRTPDPYDRNHDDLEAFRQEVREGMEEMRQQHAALLSAIGKPADDGKGLGGTGLWGEVLRLKTDVKGLLDLKTKGMGFIGAIIMFGALIILGFKGWIAGIVPQPVLPR
jgi:hypothetical protein